MLIINKASCSYPRCTVYRIYRVMVYIDCKGNGISQLSSMTSENMEAFDEAIVVNSNIGLSQQLENPSEWMRLHRNCVLKR